MNILVTGAGGFVGKNLVATLENIRDGKDRTRPRDSDIDIFSYDLDTDPALLDGFCRDADFVFHLAGCQPPGEGRGLHARELRIYLRPSRYAEKISQSRPRDDFFFDSGAPRQSLR